MTIRWCCLVEAFEKIKPCTNPSSFFLLSKSWQIAHCWLFSWLLDLGSATVIVRGIKMELSASRVCWLAWLCPGQRTCYSWEGLRMNNRLYLTRSHTFEDWQIVTYICTNDPWWEPMQIMQPLCQPFRSFWVHSNPALSWYWLLLPPLCDRTMGSSFGVGKPPCSAKNWSLWATTLEG